jgi:hypothetical protein
MPDSVKDVRMWRLNTAFSIKIAKNLKYILIADSFDVNVLHFV